MQKPVPFAALIGIDWADRKHDVCLCAAGSSKRERAVIPHTPAAIRDWADQLRARFGGAPIAVCIELSQGPIVSALLQYDIFVLFPVQPKTLARYRAAFATSGLIIGATFAAFSYFSPIFLNVAGVSAAAIPNLLAMYGVANIIGNAVAGRFADRHTLTVLVAGLSVLALALVSFALWAQSTPVGIAAFAAIGLTGVSLNPAMVARVMRAATPGPLVNTMHTSVITAGLAFGTWAGGAAIDAGYGMRSPLWIGAAMATLGLASLLPYLRSGLAQAPDAACTTS